MSTVGDWKPDSPAKIGIGDIDFQQLLTSIQHAQNGHPVHQHIVEQFFSPQRMQEMGLTEEGRQFDEGLGFQREQLGEEGRMFDLTHGLSRDEFEESQRQFNTNADLRNQLLGNFGFLDEGGGGFFEGSGQGFTDLLNEQRNVTQGLLSDIQNFGDSQRSAINQRFDTTANNAVANLERRGLGASSLVAPTAGAVEQGRTQSLRELEDSLLGQRIDTTQEQFGDIFDTQNRELDRRAQQVQGGVSLIGGLF